MGTTDGWQTVTITGVVPDDSDVVRINLVSKNSMETVRFRALKRTRQDALGV